MGPRLGSGAQPLAALRFQQQEDELKNKKVTDKADQRNGKLKANHDRAERETLEERVQQEAGRDTKPEGINKDKSRQPGTR